MIGKVYEDWKKVNITTVFIRSEKEDLGIYKLVSLTSISVKVMEQILSETIIKHVKNK